MFCKQDRAILCKECDFPIHSANEHTQKHDRFLLTGVKLSNTATTASDSNSNLVSSSATTLINNNKVAILEGSGCTTTSTSSISQYLIETLPGWQVEDFLDPSSVTVPFGFSKVCNFDWYFFLVYTHNIIGKGGPELIFVRPRGK